MDSCYGIKGNTGNEGSILIYQHLFDYFFHAFQIIQRVMAEPVMYGVTVFAFAPALIIVYGGSFFTAFFIDQQRSHAVGAEIQANKQIFHNIPFSGLLPEQMLTAIDRQDRSGYRIAANQKFYCIDKICHRDRTVQWNCGQSFFHL